VSQTAVVARLAVRELWISFRLLLLLAAYVAVGAFVALVPAQAATAFGRLAIGLTAAAILGAAVAGESISTERAQGRAAWLVTRSISRGTLLIGWFVALAGVSLVGIGAAGLPAWIAVAGSLPVVEPAAFVAVMAGVAATSLAGLAVGLLVGTLLRPRAAAAAALAIGVAVVGAGTVLLPSGSLPATALAGLVDLDRPIAAGLRGAGAALATAALVLVLARLALGRVDL
jgi:ABC-type transport system involved in multi-copper enzyme maturation permease subunit